MPNRGAVLAVLISLTVAFLWGFKRDLISSLFASSAQTEAPVPAVAEQNPIGGPQQTQGELNKAAVPVPAFPGPPVKVNNLTNTLDSIRPGQMPPAQVTQRNEYFEKLSQQLRELQGGTPPPPSVPNEGPPPLPPPGNGGVPQVPPNFPGAGQPEPGFEAGSQAMPQVDFDQQTPKAEDDEADVDEADDDSDADVDAEIE